MRYKKLWETVPAFTAFGRKSFRFFAGIAGIDRVCSVLLAASPPTAVAQQCAPYGPLIQMLAAKRGEQFGGGRVMMGLALLNGVEIPARADSASLIKPRARSAQ